MDQITILEGKVFKCRQCGSCCRHINHIPDMEEYDSGDGSCKFLQNNKCSIYNQRPDICRGEYLYHKYFEGMDIDEYYKFLYYYCDMIRGGKIDWKKTM